MQRMLELLKLLLLSSLLLLVSVSSLSSAKMSSKSQSLGFAVNQFSFSLYNEIAKQSSDENVFYSPFSISSAFAMVLVGAKGNTEKQLRAALSLDKVLVNQEDANAAFEEVLEQVPSDGSKNYSLDIANRILIKDELKVLPCFTETVAEKYRSQVDRVDFAKDGQKVTSDVNNWVNDKTKGMIQKLLAEPLSSSTALVILNAIYFKGQWVEEFSKTSTKPGPFYGKVTNENVDFMQMTEKFMYSHNEEKKYRMLRMPYIGNFSMIVILPEDKGGLDSLLKSISLADIESQMKQMRQEKVILKFPKFKMETNYDLVPLMKRLGATDAFDSEADFSGITGAKDLVASKAIHKAVIEVNEKGTKAAAATAIVMVPMMAMPPRNQIRFTANQPFLYFIREETSGLILFMGRVVRL